MLKIIRYIIILNLIFILTGCLTMVSDQINVIEKRESVIFSSESKSALKDKYAKDARESDFYWKSLSIEVKEFKNLNPSKEKVELNDIDDFLAEVWGYLILHSVPSEADVHIKNYRDYPSEGKTTVGRWYPARTYTFQLKKDTFKLKEVDISIIANDTIEMTVKLEKVEENF